MADDLSSPWLCCPEICLLHILPRDVRVRALHSKSLPPHPRHHTVFYFSMSHHSLLPLLTQVLTLRERCWLDAWASQQPHD